MSEKRKLFPRRHSQPVFSILRAHAQVTIPNTRRECVKQSHRWRRGVINQRREIAVELGGSPSQAVGKQAGLDKVLLSGLACRSDHLG